MTGKDNPNAYEFENYCSFVEGTLIGRVMPGLLEDGTLDNRVACCHVNESFASLIAIPPELRRHSDPDYEADCKLLNIISGLSDEIHGVDVEEELKKKEQRLRASSPNTDVWDVALRFEHYSRREHNGWHYIAVQHDEKTQALYEAILLFHKNTFQITKGCLDGKETNSRKEH